MTYNLDGKVAFVTGGGRGQGRSHALAFARAGAKVAFCDFTGSFDHTAYAINRPGDIAETEKLVKAAGGECLAIEADVRSLPEMERAVGEIVERWGRLDIAVANAGIDSYTPVQAMTAQQWQDTIDVNLTGVFNTIRAVSPRMVEQRSGSIVGISSSVGKVGTANNPAYIASKWGVIGLVKAAAVDLGPHFVRVNAVCPGYISTEMINNGTLPPMFFPDNPDATEDDVTSYVNWAVHTIPAGRLDSEEVSNAVLFLSSDQSRYISGSTIDVNAGWSARFTA
ncbi:mycofactocin-coupled SDR family oxidoreductase [Amycolatopsis viridis]|uniref:SDR family mycofactocin-dependent oxidoreductase n=1 Tax=Amycolatopsis viridis TaxID=185678 RepID=A0ABX0SZ39_9PSEU|nr:mycofactocin-coupled SDR family oxidoreductase [Amycolatopsis viridis]NIH82248.1 SDR family mycofactocin-dependent oxidoreductase [Amycolatopsis viridis]